MRDRDEAKKTWLSNFLIGELHSLLASDKHDLQSHLASQSADFEKLAKVVNKLAGEHQSLSQRFLQTEEDLRFLEDEM
jgi:F0F1-type ATP synthase delta subunit